MARNRFNLPHLGYGLGLRQPHYDTVVASQVPVEWFEILSENFMEAHPGHLEFLQDVRAKYPLVMHGVAMSIGSTDPINESYIEKLKRLADVVRPAWISDHLCFTGTHGVNSHDLLPVPYTKEALTYITARVKRVQDMLGRPLILENPSTYAEFTASSIPEWEFIAELAEAADCGLLLDVNNVYVSAFNHRYDAKRYIDAIPADRVVYIHLAGHRNFGTHIIDTHDDHVIDAVWDLYRYTVARNGETSTMVEWDGNIPAFDVLLSELGKARDVVESAKKKGSIMSTYPELLDGMMNAVLAGDTSQARTFIRDKKDFAPEDQLAVYVNGYRIRLTEVIESVYPALLYAMGKADFKKYVSAFIENTPSRYFNIDKYPIPFGEFVARTSSSVFVQDLAALESAIHDVYQERETPPIAKDWIERQTPESLAGSVFLPRAASRLLAFTYPVNDYLSALRAEEKPSKPAPEATALLVFRHNHQVQRLPLAEAEHALFSILASGKTLDGALEDERFAPYITSDNLSADLMQWFARWVREGCLRQPV